MRETQAVAIANEGEREREDAQLEPGFMGSIASSFCFLVWLGWMMMAFDKSKCPARSPLRNLLFSPVTTGRSPTNAATAPTRNPKWSPAGKQRLGRASRLSVLGVAVTLLVRTNERASERTSAELQIGILRQSQGRKDKITCHFANVLLLCAGTERALGLLVAISRHGRSIIPVDELGPVLLLVVARDGGGLGR
jgi:hypothetical protein